MDNAPTAKNQSSDQQRQKLLQDYEALLETPLLLLGLVWMVLIIVELREPANRLFNVFGTAIWLVFLADFALRFTWAPQKARFLKANWLIALSLLLPALRVFQATPLMGLLQSLRLAPSISLVPAVASLGQSLRDLGVTLGQRGFGYAVALTIIVTFAGAAGMYIFEHDASGSAGFNTYGSALWFTTMIIMTMGSNYWPVTPEGQLLCVFLALYAISIFGYVTATLASFFVGQDAQGKSAAAVTPQDIEMLRSQLEAMSAQLSTLTQRQEG